MAKREFAELISSARLKLWVGAPEAGDGRPQLARAVLEPLERGDVQGAEEAFFSFFGDRPGDYFYNLSPSKKRQFFAGVAIAACEHQDDIDSLFEMMKARKLTGRTYTLPNDAE